MFNSNVQKIKKRCKNFRNGIGREHKASQKIQSRVPRQAKRREDQSDHEIYVRQLRYYLPSNYRHRFSE